MRLHWCALDRTCRSAGTYGFTLRIGQRWWSWPITRRMEIVDHRVYWLPGVDIERPRRIE